jgi:exopolysaccharide biosynthesis polyprenyl glycosylphosphotransferase
MLRRQRQVRTQFQKLMDAGLFALAFWLAHYLRSSWLNDPSVWKFFEFFGGTAEIQKFNEYAWLLLLILPVSPFLLETQGFYNRPLNSSRKRTAWQLFKASFLMVIVVISVMFLTRDLLSRSVIILSGGISFFLVLMKEELIRKWIQSKAGEQLKKRVILVGTPEDSERLTHEMERSHGDLEILAHLDLNVNSIDELVELLHTYSANSVIISAKHTYFGQVEKAIQACELEGVESWLLADFFNTQVSQTILDDFHGRPILVFRSTPADSWQNVAKQVIDVFGAAVLLFLFMPLLLTVGLWIKISSPGPVLFRQQRSGLNGRPFTMLKFRSMVSDAEQLKQELAALNEMSGPVFKLTDDPRVTPVGRFLRRYSIDELPQLFNVLRGEMSLVGPRPLPVDEVKRFDDLSHRRRLSVRPGLTCLWQVSGRNNVTDFKDWVRLDLEYIDNWSLWLDLKILVRTVPVVFLGTGAK